MARQIPKENVIRKVKSSLMENNDKNFKPEPKHIKINLFGGKKTA